MSIASYIFTSGVESFPYNEFDPKTYNSKKKKKKRFRLSLIFREKQKLSK